MSRAPMLRTWHHAEFPEARLRAAKRGRSVSVCLPARDEAATIGSIVRVCRDLQPLVDEVVVVDDGSTDDTRVVASAAGARVVGQRRAPRVRAREREG